MTGNDVLDLAAAARPTTATARRLRSEEQAAEALASILDGTRTVAVPRPSHRRRYAVGAVAAGVVVAAVIAGSVVLPSNSPVGPTAASAYIDRLAAKAGVAPADTMRPDQFWHSVERSEQGYYGESGTRKVTRTMWTAADGTVWRRDRNSTRAETYLFPPEASPSINAPTPGLLATYPTDRNELDRFIDEKYADLFEDHDTRVVGAVHDMLWQGFAPPALRAAALQVVADLPSVQVLEGVKDPAGRIVTVLRIESESGMGPSTSDLFVDPTTARIVGQRSSYVPRKPPPTDGPKAPISFSSVTLDVGVTDAVPADIRRSAVDQSRTGDTECTVNGTC